MNQEENIEDIHNEIERRKEYEKSDTWAKIPKKHKYLIGGLIIFVVGYFIYTNKDMKFGFFLIGAILFIVYIASSGDFYGQDVLDIEESVAMLKYKLRKFQLEGVLPQGSISIDRLVGKLKYLDGKPWKRELSFKVVPRGRKLAEVYSAELAVYGAGRGDIIGIYRRPFGFHGHSPDVEKIYRPSASLMNDRRVDSYAYKR